MFPSLKSKYGEDDLSTDASTLSFSKADKLVASEKDLAESETIRDMTDSLQDLQSFGVKLNSDMEDAISDHIDTLDASGGDPPALLQKVFSSSKTQGRLRIPGAQGTPQPLLIICEDPAHCPPPAPSYQHPYRRPHYRPGPGLNICRDPNNCPGYRPGRRPYRIKVSSGNCVGGNPSKQFQKPVKPTELPPTYQPETETPTYKKYGYNPDKLNPTIWRQQIMKVNSVVSRNYSKLNDLLQKKKPINVGNKDSLPSKVTDEDVNHIRNIQKDFVSKYKKKPVKIMDVIDLKQVEEMSLAQLKDVIKEAAMEEVEEEKLEKLIIPKEELTTVAPVIEDAINKVSF